MYNEHNIRCSQYTERLIERSKPTEGITIGHEWSVVKDTSGEGEN
jgi:hypothetical protein